MIIALATLAVFALAAAPTATFSDCADCPEMVQIPPGSALLGSNAEERARAGIVPIFGDREGPIYQVSFAQGYALSKTEVTRAQYRKFVDATDRPDPPACGNHEPTKDFWGPRPGFNWRKPGFEQDDTHPVVCIGHDDATAYAAWLSRKTGKSYRLPSDAEWEYAARAGSSTPWYWGERGEDGCGVANLMSAGTVARLGFPKSIADRFVCSSPRAFSLPVGSFPPNAFGLHDMAGNAFEWVADCNAPDNSSAPPDGRARSTGDCARHYLKGGAFHTPFWLTRSAVRGAPLAGDIRMFTMGIRVARSLDPKGRP